ncbi:MAG: DUF2948 family protein [Pseudomonadota bacterium]
MSDPTPLRLIAEDTDDLKVISAALQDSVTKAGNLKFDRRARRFTIEVNRFRWEDVGEPKQRVRAILGIDSVLGVRVRGLPPKEPDLVISLLSLEFAADETPPGGRLTLLLAGDGEIVLEIEALDVTLLDSDYIWPTRNEPSHERRRR